MTVVYCCVGSEPLSPTPPAGWLAAWDKKYESVANQTQAVQASAATNGTADGQGQQGAAGRGGGGGAAAAGAGGPHGGAALSAGAIAGIGECGLLPFKRDALESACHALAHDRPNHPIGRT